MYYVNIIFQIDATRSYGTEKIIIVECGYIQWRITPSCRPKQNVEECSVADHPSIHPSIRPDHNAVP